MGMRRSDVEMAIRQPEELPPDGQWRECKFLRRFHIGFGELHRSLPTGSKSESISIKRNYSRNHKK